MKIDYCLMGCTENPFYFDFWPIVSKVWKKKFNIIPVLGLICDEDSDLINDEYGLIKKFKKSNFSDDGTQSQVVRLFLSKFLNGTCIISDIDMIPLSENYFIDNLIKFKDTDLLVLSSHHPQTINTNQYPMCYIVGNSKIFDEIFQTNVSWDEFVEKTTLNGWYSDQLFLYQSIQNYGLDNVKFPYRSFIDDRVDRIHWVYNDNLLKNGHYIDSHLLRPYQAYKNEVDRLIELIIE
jgi:hypothetical protein